MASITDRQLSTLKKIKFPVKSLRCARLDALEDHLEMFKDCSIVYLKKIDPNSRELKRGRKIAVIQQLWDLLNIDQPLPIFKLPRLRELKAIEFNRILTMAKTNEEHLKKLRKKLTCWMKKVNAWRERNSRDSEDELIIDPNDPEEIKYTKHRDQYDRLLRNALDKRERLIRCLEKIEKRDPEIHQRVLKLQK